MTTLDVNLERIKKTYSYEQDPKGFLDAAAGVMAEKAREIYKLPNLRTPDVTIINRRNNELGIDPNSINAAYAQGTNQIYVTKGLTDHLSPEQALAALGHEIGHQIMEESGSGASHSVQHTPDGIIPANANEARDELLNSSDYDVLNSNEYEITQFSDSEMMFSSPQEMMFLLHMLVAAHFIMSDPNYNPLSIMDHNSEFETMPMEDDQHFSTHNHSTSSAQQEEYDADEIAAVLTNDPELVKNTLRIVDPEGAPDPTGVHPQRHEREQNIDEFFGLKRFA